MKSPVIRDVVEKSGFCSVGKRRWISSSDQDVGNVHWKEYQKNHKLKDLLNFGFHFHAIKGG